MLHDQLQVARQSIQQASDNAEDSDVRNQLQSLDEGLGELDDEGKTEASDAAEETDRLTEMEEKLSGLLDRTDGAAQEEIEEARDAIDVFRQEHTDWDGEGERSEPSE